VPGTAYAYSYDGIGNRTHSWEASDSQASGRGFAKNSLNQLDSRYVKPFVDVAGYADPSYTVLVNNVPVARDGSVRWHHPLAVDNAAGPVAVDVNVEILDGETLIRQYGYTKILAEDYDNYAYDMRGSVFADSVFGYEWNDEGRLSAIYHNSSIPEADRVRLEFEYDALGRRIKKTVKHWDTSAWSSADSVTKFVWDGWMLIAELDGLNSDTLLRSYVWGQDMSGSVGGAGGVGGLLAVNHHDASTGAITATYYVVRDDAGNTVALIERDSQGGAHTTVATFEYSPFGEIMTVDTSLTGSDAPTQGHPTALCPFLFSQRYYDAEVGLYYYGHRYYEPEIGKWLSRDPLQEQGGLNQYAFCKNDPKNCVDPLGLTSSGDVEWRVNRANQQLEKINKTVKKLDRLKSRGAASVAELWAAEKNAADAFETYTEYRQDAERTCTDYWEEIWVVTEGRRRLHASVMALPLTVANLRPTISQLEQDMATSRRMVAAAHKVADRIPESTVDQVHLILDGIGCVPVLGDVADGINALIYVGEGRFGEAALSAIAFVPLAGDALAKGGKLVAKYGDEAVTAFKLSRKYGDEAVEGVQAVARYGDEAADAATSLRKAPIGCFVAGTLVQTPTGDRPIQTVLVGHRVYASEGDETAGEDDSEDDLCRQVTPATWRKITLRMPNPAIAGGSYDIVLLRPLTWMLRAGCEQGNAMDFAIPEMGLEGKATVVAIEPCPVLEGGEGRLVLSTVTHVNPAVCSLTLEDQATPLEPTINHRLYSEDRNAWIPAGELEIGERLRTATGASRVLAIRYKQTPERVFNLEVQIKHCYYVGHKAVLAHNQCAASPIPGKPIGMDEALERADAFLDLGTPIRSVDNKTGVQFIQRSGDGSITKRVGFDLDPNSQHVQDLGPHLNLQTQKAGKVVTKGPLKDPHMSIDPATIRLGDY
jgi:RHS repeat-associated protein